MPRNFRGGPHLCRLAKTAWEVVIGADPHLRGGLVHTDAPFNAHRIDIMMKPSSRLAMASLGYWFRHSSPEMAMPSRQDFMYEDANEALWLVSKLVWVLSGKTIDSRWATPAHVAHLAGAGP